MSDAPAVSVVIPCHDAAGLLSLQLAALAGQEEAPDFEVVVVDDRSTDDLAVFADRFEDAIEVYSPDPLESLELLAPFLADGHVALLFALDGDEHPDADLFTDGTDIGARLVGGHDLSPFRPAHAVRHLVGFAVPERDLPPGYRLI